jgi:putative SbcD/Mre11-related phosphoesterase
LGYLEMMFEIFKGVYTVADLPLVYVPSFRAVVMADIHLGFEEDMASKGIYLPRTQLSKALDILDKVLNFVEVSMLIVAGDIKHHFEKLGRKEARDLKDFLEVAVKKFKKVVVVRGNHDTYLMSICRKFEVKLFDALWLGTILVVHGHRDLEYRKDFDIVIMGHEHPSIALKDPISGYSTKFPCFLLTPLKHGGYALILPAIGVYQSGTSISTYADGYLSPIIRSEADLENAKPFVIVEGEGVVELPRLKLIEDLLKFF